jgi:hypothetical protein
LNSSCANWVASRRHHYAASLKSSMTTSDAYADLKEQVAEVKRMPYRFMQSLSSTG